MLKKLNSTEYSLIFSVVLLLIIGIIIIASVSSTFAQDRLGNPYHYIIRHVFYIFFGLFLILIISKINLDFIKKYSFVLILTNIILLFLVLKFGFSAGGASRWLALGPFTIQPSEFLKLTFLIYFCSWLSKKTAMKTTKKNKNNSNLTRGLLVCFFFFIVSAFLLVMQPDASNLGILFFTLIIVYFFSENPIWHTFLIASIGLASLWTLIKLAPYRLERLQVFFNPDMDPMGIGYQIKQISIAIGSGGLFGLGWGMSKQKLGFLPEPMTDTIFAVLSEETGFIGAGLVIILFLIFLCSGFSISKNASDKFSTLLSAGIVSWITMQAFINIAAMVRIFPLTGVPLPFISYGGSHMVTELIAIGLLLNISRRSKIK